MSCNDINGMSGISCVKSMGGLKKVWIFPFDTINEYIYTNDYLQKITGYSSTILPVEYIPNIKSSEYKAVENQDEYKMYDHSLNLAFSKMEASKREELIKLESMELTIIFQDRNDICWIMGQDFPVKLTTVEVKSGVKGGDSLYNLTFTSKEKNHIREIECPSDVCFVSFKGIENRVSTIYVTDASTLTWRDFVITADSQILSYTSSYTLDPTTWGSPVSLTQDLNQLSLLINQYGTHVVPNVTLLGSYDAFDDIAIITIISDNTSYGAFEIDNTVYNSTISIILNLITTVSPFIANPSTIINVEDSLGNLYNTAYGSTVIASGVSGLAQNSFIDAGNLYPRGTTFTMSIDGLPCATQTYNYSFEPTIPACEILASHEFYKGEFVNINVPYVVTTGAPKYQNIYLNIFGQIYQMYMIYTDHHSDDNQFENDLINLLNQVPVKVDPSSVVFYHNATSVDILFKTVNLTPSVDNPFFKSYVRGFEQPSNPTTGWKQSVVLGLTTAAPYPSILSIEDEYSNIIKGENIVNITSNLTYMLGSTPVTSNTSIDDIGLVWALSTDTPYSLPYNEQSILTLSIDSPTCLAGDLLIGFDDCYTGYDSNYSGSFMLMSLDVTGYSINAGKTFTIVTNNQTVNLTCFLDVTPTNNMHLLTQQINSSVRGVKVIHMDFNPLLRTYNIYVKMDIGTSILSMTETTFFNPFTLSSVYQLFTNTLLTKVNPYITIDWTCPTVSTSTPTGPNNLTVGHWQEDYSVQDALEVAWSQGADSINMIKGYTAASTAATAYVVSFHEDYPTSSNSFLTLFLPAGSASLSTGSITSTLVTNGSSVADIRYVAYTNYIGWRYIQEIDLTAVSQNIYFDEFSKRPIMWGTMDALEYVGTTSSSTPTVESVVCYLDCCNDLVEPIQANTDIVYTYTGSPDEWDSTVEFTTNVRCDIAYVTITVTPNFGAPTVDAGSPINYKSEGCILGNHLFSSLASINFTGDPTGFTYQQLVSLYDITHNLITSYTIPVTF